MKPEKKSPRRELVLLAALAVVVVSMILWVPSFEKAGNLRVLLQSVAVDVLVAVPMTIALLGGVTDVSAGATLCLSSAFCALLLEGGAPVPLAAGVCLASGLLLGIVNGLGVSRLGIPSLPVTIGTCLLYRGLGEWLLGGGAIYGFPDAFGIFGRTTLYNVPIAVLYTVAALPVGYLLLRWGPVLRHARTVGTHSRKDKRLTVRFQVCACALTGLVASFAGLASISRADRCAAGLGEGLEIRVMVGILLGGVSLAGGHGTLTGAILGVLLMQLATNSLKLLFLNQSVGMMLYGLLLLVVLWLDLRRRRLAKAEALGPRKGLDTP